MFSDLGRQAMEYLRDAQQRSVLYLDVMRQSGDQYVEHASQGKPPVLVFEHELIVDGRQLPDPVNYALLRIVPPEDMPTNPDARPFVIIDPRAGHGPGVAGSKVHSEVGVALAAGHPCYFVTFGPDPEPNQSIYCIMKAEKYFLEVVAQRHDPQRVGRPFVIGNCQGGWALMMLASADPKLVGPIMLAGAPLAYWSGKAGQNPMRYSGGMLGGSWASSLASDIGGGIFDGVYLVENFERLDPANTFWKKPYHLYANIDTEVERYLGFDRWWAGHFMMTRQEMDWIVQNLFIGNRLARAELPDPLSNGNINLRNIRSPIVVFASQADNITPPPQALNWIADVYASDEDLKAHEQVIIYCLHETTGHLGIFVSSGVANREHEALVGALDLIELLPPGLYEARIQDLHPDTPHQEWVKGRHVVTFEPRSIADLQALDDGREEEAHFEVVNRVSQINQHLYDLTLSPIVRSLTNPWIAQASRALHPQRFGRYMWSSLNPVALSFKAAAEQVRKQRTPVAADNVFLAMERVMSDGIARSWDVWRDIRDQSVEAIFHGVYGSPWLRALVGLDKPQIDRRGILNSDTALHEELHELRLQLTKAQVQEGDAADAFARILIYMAGEETFVDERAFNLLESLAKDHIQGYKLPDLASIKQKLRKQWRIMQMHPQDAIAALPLLVPNERQRQVIWDAVAEISQLKDVLNLSAESQARFADIACALELCSHWEPPVEVATKIAAEQAQREAEQRAQAQAEQQALLDAAKAEAMALMEKQASAEIEKALLQAQEQAKQAMADAEQAKAYAHELKAQLDEALQAKPKTENQAKAVPTVETKVSVEPTAKKAAKKAAKKTTARKATKKSTAVKTVKKTLPDTPQTRLALEEELPKPSAAWPTDKKTS
ncbi:MULTISPECIES: DUF3141 domain-containing protein [Paenalcaligenes]|uniref:DUF3141 domain-containing protein n=1 Tax=Paenalcaligenes hermetiae TaxID=1157987 RepID=A0ABP9LVM4_9BURK|nr:DUF3141 domain-containing protein [Paenalcaligenes sp.]